MPSKGKPDYKELVAEAEAAVAAMKDPELRRAAFEKILEQLLGQHSGSPASSPSIPKAAKRAAAPRETVKSPKVQRGPSAYIGELVDDGFFNKPKTIADVKAELANRGHHVPLTSLSGPLQKLCQTRQLRRQRAKGDGNKKSIFSYSNW